MYARPRSRKRHMMLVIGHRRSTRLQSTFYVELPSNYFRSWSRFYKELQQSHSDSETRDARRSATGCNKAFRKLHEEHNVHEINKLSIGETCEREERSLNFQMYFDN